MGASCTAVATGRHVSPAAAAACPVHGRKAVVPPGVFGSPPTVRPGPGVVTHRSGTWLEVGQDDLRAGEMFAWSGFSTFAREDCDIHGQFRTWVEDDLDFDESADGEYTVCVSVELVATDPGASPDADGALRITVVDPADRSRGWGYMDVLNRRDSQQWWAHESEARAAGKRWITTLSTSARHLGTGMADETVDEVLAARNLEAVGIHPDNTAAVTALGLDPLQVSSWKPLPVTEDQVRLALTMHPNV